MFQATRHTLLQTEQTFVVEDIQAIGHNEFRLIIEAAPSGMIVVGKSGKIVLLNAQVERLFGYQREELIGKPVEVLIPPRFHSKKTNLWKDLQEASDVFGMWQDMPLFGLRKDGTEFPLEIGVNPMTTESKKFTLVCVQDISDRTRAEERFRLVVEAAPSGMIMVDTDGIIVLVNTQAETIFGYTRSELVGQPIEKLVPLEARAVHPSHRAAFLKDPKVRAMGHGRELHGLKKDGTEIPVEIGLNPISTEAGQFILASIVDITERRRAQSELMRAKEDLEQRVHERTRELEERSKQLEERTKELVISNQQLGEASVQAQAASRLKSEFLANMSHEIRTPMNAIIGMCNVLLRTPLEPRQHQYAGSIKDGANALLTVMNDILDFSKIEAGKLELEIVDFDAIKIVEGTCELLATAARAKQLSLMAFIDPRLKQHLRGDPERLRQVLLNLTSNAIKFSDHGEIVVRADVISSDAKNITVRFSVIDNGIGLTLPEKNRLFQPFVQADGSISRRFGGTGLGLSISKRLVELMNGQIGVESSKGTGSTFWIELTFEKGSEPVLIANREYLSDAKILVIDDEPHARQILSDYISCWGMAYGVASSAKEGLRALRQAYVDGESYKIAIIDYVMPEINGFDLAKQIVADPAIGATKLILLTAFDAPGLGMQAIDSGFSAFLTKPVRQSQMLECIMTVLNGEQAIARSAVDAKQAVRELNSMRNELVLVAEDYPINQQVAQLYLDELGFASHVVGNGIEAVDAITQHDYAIIFMDCQMPEMDGFAATAAIRKLEQPLQRHTPIIAMTAHAMAGDRERCIAAGMDDYVSKPVDPEALRRIIEKWLPVRVSSVTNTDQLAVLDLCSGKEKYGPNAERLLKMFIQEVPTQIEQIQKAADLADIKALFEVVHGLKGICGTMFAQRMRHTCVEMESAISSRNMERLNALIERLHHEFKQLQEHVACHETMS